MQSNKKVKSKDMPGYIGELTDNQIVVFRSFKDWIAVNFQSAHENPWLNDMFLIRFCRARKFDLPKICEMFVKYMKYREDNKIDTIGNEQIVTPELNELMFNYYGRGYMGVDKIGRPIYIELSGQMRPDKLWETVDEPTLVRQFIQMYEEVVKLHFYACSYVAKKQIYHTFSILDMTGFSVSMFNNRVKRLVKLGSSIAQDYYPEQLGQLMITNAPWVFTGIWSVVKGFIDEKTRKKIQIIGGSYKKELLKYIDEDQLASCLGGKNNARLIDNIGPWSDFEIVDGFKKGEVVGIRKKSDGPNGPVFTPNDLEQLPNYLLADPSNPQQLFGPYGDPTKSVLETAQAGAQQFKFEEEKQSDSQSQLEYINITRPNSAMSEDSGDAGGQIKSK